MNFTKPQWIFRSEIFARLWRFLWRHPAKTGPKYNFFLEAHGNTKLDQDFTWHIYKQLSFSWTLAPRRPCKRYWRSKAKKNRQKLERFSDSIVETSERKNSDKYHNNCVKCVTTFKRRRLWNFLNFLDLPIDSKWKRSQGQRDVVWSSRIYF